MLTVRPLYCPAAGVPSTAQASRMRGRRHAAAKSPPARVSVNGSVVAPGKRPSRRAHCRRFLKSVYAAVAADIGTSLVSRQPGDPAATCLRRRNARLPGIICIRLQITAVLYWNNPFGPVRWRQAERRFLSCGCLLANARSWPGPCGDAGAAWRAAGVAARCGAGSGAGNRRARARRGDAGSGQRRQRAISGGPVASAVAAGGRCRQMSSPGRHCGHLGDPRGAGGISRGRGWCRHLPRRSRWPGRRSRCRTGRYGSGWAAR